MLQAVTDSEVEGHMRRKGKPFVYFFEDVINKGSHNVRRQCAVKPTTAHLAKCWGPCLVVPQVFQISCLDEAVASLVLVKDSF
jgi:hypothetical protein